MQLAPALTFCTVQGRPVFLDLERDRYFCLGRGLEAAWSACLGGSAGSDEIDRLLRHGLVVPASGQAIDACPSAIAEKSVLDSAATAASFRRLITLAWILARTRWLLRNRGLAKLSEILELCRSRYSDCSSEQSSLVAIAHDFERLGMLTSALDQCLPRSIALGLYLHRRGHAPEVVLGVRMGPFRAHCWVECEGLLVNDRFERVRHYTPIRRL